MKKLLISMILVIGLFFTSCGGMLDISNFPGYPGIESFSSMAEALAWLQENGHARPEDSFVKSLSGEDLITIQVLDNAVLMNGILYEEK